MKKPIVVINHKAEVLSYYESIDECIRMNGFPPDCVYKAVAENRIYKCMKFIHEPIYRQHWMNGTTDQLKFKTKKKRNLEQAKYMLAARINPKVEQQRRRKLSEYQKGRVEQGLISNLRKGAEKRRRPVRCIDTGKVYKSITELANELKINDSYISRVIKNNWNLRGQKYEYINK